MTAVNWMQGRWQRALCELKEFDWQLMRQPSSLGRWPAVLRFSILVLCVVWVLGLTFSLPFLLGSRVSIDEYGVLTAIEEKISIQRKKNLFAAAQNLELERRNVFAHALLPQNIAQVPDITQTMDMIRVVASGSGVQLLSVTPDFVAEKDLEVRLRARLLLSSLSTFWRVLSEISFNVGVSQIVLESTEKPDIFELNLSLIVPLAAQVNPSSLLLGEYAVPTLAASDSSEEVINGCSAKLCSKQKRDIGADSKGFLLRAGSSQFLYLVRNDKGHLTGVEE